MAAVGVVEFSPYAYAIHEDPYPTYTRLRDEAPAYRNDELDFWALSRHADVLEGFRDAERLSSAYGPSLDPAAWGPNAHRTASFLAMDEPRHGRMRALVSRGFTPRRVQELEARIRAITAEHLVPVLDGDGRFDLIRDVAGKVPMDVISELIGVPPEDRGELRRLADLVVHREEGIEDVPPAGIDAALTLVSYYAEMVADRHRTRRDDLPSALLDATIDGDRLTDDEIVGFLFLMVVAGNETTTKLLGNAWYWGWRFPDERALAFADRSRVEDWVEETLRFDTSSQMIARRCVHDIEVHGHSIRPGDRVLLLIGAANRDPRAFDDADAYRFDRDRTRTPIASFGFGRHFCLGAALARLETRVVLEELLHAVVDYEVDAEGAERVHSANVRGFSALPTSVVLH
jgi:hypothetical protein